MRKIFLVAYYYPPIIGGGVQRIKNFISNICNTDVKPVVVTVKPNQTVNAEENVIRVRNLGLRFDSKINSNGRKPQIQNNSSCINKIGKLVKGLIKKLLIPDAKILWAVAVSIKLLKSGLAKDDIVLTSSPPNSSHIVGLIIKKFKKTQWIADFRDAWTIDPLDEEFNKRKIRRTIEKFLERAVIKNCDNAILNTEYSCKLYKEKYAEYKNKFTTINNGFNSGLFEASRRNIKSKADLSSITLAHFGALSKSHFQRTINNFIDAVGLIKENHGGKPVNVILKFYGDLTDEEIQLINECKTSFHLEYVGQLKYEKAVEEMLKCNALILIDRCIKENGGNATNIPGKVYDYLGCRKPIIPIIPDGACMDLLKNVGISRFASPCDVMDIKEIIIEFIDKYNINNLEGFLPLEEEANNYSSEAMSKKLLNIIHG